MKPSINDMMATSKNDHMVTVVPIPALFTAYGRRYNTHIFTHTWTIPNHTIL